MHDIKKSCMTLIFSHCHKVCMKLKSHIFNVMTEGTFEGQTHHITHASHTQGQS